MIIVRLMGGLGNQLFQYALGRRLALERGVKVKFDPKFFAVVKNRPYALDNFNTKVEFASDQEVDEVKGKNLTGIRKRIIYKWQEKLPYFKRRYVKEAFFEFDPKILEVGKSAYLEGYWQTEKYFEPVADDLRTELSPLNPLAPEAVKWDEQIADAPESVSIHLRRGDYVRTPESKEGSSAIQLVYYLDAIQHMDASLDGPEYFVFSDDIRWAEEHLPRTSKIHFLSHGPEVPDVNDLILMSHCRHHILANSSFSWWGAWLSTDPGKIVIAPKIWFPDSIRDTEDIYGSNWVRL